VSHIETGIDWGRAERARVLPQAMVALGAVAHADLGHWHAWMSLTGNEITTVGVYRTEGEARALIAELMTLLAHWDGTEASFERMNELLARAMFESAVAVEAMALPEAQTREILAMVAIAAAEGGGVERN
jgi:hypothetical protein